MYKFKIGRGVRQIDGVSPKLFTTILERVVKKLDWSGLGSSSIFVSQTTSYTMLKESDFGPTNWARGHT